ncbi:MAG TPA: S8 family serine peptidase [Actinocrinis sp.]|nr:S8 family serine peptidase [Actinocrinis sp.]HEV2344264.1 S8 family serine peptidase [Actinocrinis sp.]
MIARTDAGTGSPDSSGPGRLTWKLALPSAEVPGIPSDWPMERLRDWAWGGATGAGVRVCILDSGIEPDHPLVGPLDGAYAAVPAQDAGAGYGVLPEPPHDRFGHGTACAGIIRSLAPQCSLTSVRVLGGKTGSGDALLAGLRWAISEGFDVVNLSLSTTKPRYTPQLRELADEAFFRGTVLVASAHNMPVESFPWRFSSVISVGSHTVPDPELIYYNPYPPVEFFAQGQDVQVAWSGHGTKKVSGNSFATPRIAGLCTLVLSKHRNLRPFQIKNILFLAARNVGYRDE